MEKELKDSVGLFRLPVNLAWDCGHPLPEYVRELMRGVPAGEESARARVVRERRVVRVVVMGPILDMLSFIVWDVRCR